MKELDVLAVSVAQHDKEITQIRHEFDNHQKDTHNHGDRIERMEPIVNGNGKSPISERMASVEDYIEKAEKKADKNQNWTYGIFSGIVMLLIIAAKDTFF